MNMFDEARAIKSTMELCHLTQSELARQLGVSQSYVANKLRLLGFSEEMAEKINKAGISERHARALLRLDNEEDVLRILGEISSRALTVRECEALVDAALVTRIPERLCRADALSRIEDFSSAIRGGCEFLASQGIDAHAKTSYHAGDLYITVIVKNA